MLTGISNRIDSAKLWVGCFLDYESNGCVLNCISSCKLSKSWSVQPQVNGIPSNRRLTIVSARSDICGASYSTWSDKLIESTCTPPISSGMALAPVMIRLLLNRCSWMCAGKLSHTLNALCCTRTVVGAGIVK